MTFDDAIKKLNIEEYREQIFNSNSHGELHHLFDYIDYAELDDVSWFRKLFKMAVKMAEENWDRPESVYQHIPKIFHDWSDYANGTN